MLACLLDVFPSRPHSVSSHPANHNPSTLSDTMSKQEEKNLAGHTATVGQADKVYYTEVTKSDGLHRGLKPRHISVRASHLEARFPLTTAHCDRRCYRNWIIHWDRNCFGEWRTFGLMAWLQLCGNHGIFVRVSEKRKGCWLKSHSMMLGLGEMTS